MKKNCVNCGAPFDIEKHKCPYCNTTYFDNFMTLDLVNATPVVFKAKTPMGIIDMLCIPKLGSMSLEYSIDTTDCVSYNGVTLARYANGRNVDLNLGFSAIPMRGTNSLYNITLEEDE